MAIHSPTRRTRAQRSQETQQRLLDAAFEVFTAHGFHGSTLDQVAAAAGLTTGAVYSRYSGKAELLLALIERTVEARIAELDRLQEQGQPDVSSTWERAWWQRALERPEWMLLVIEFRVHVARDPLLNARYAALHERHVRAHARVLQADVAHAGRALTEPALDVARVTMALGPGLVLERACQGAAFDPELPMRATAMLGAAMLSPGAHEKPRRGSPTPAPRRQTP